MFLKIQNPEWIVFCTLALVWGPRSMAPQCGKLWPFKGAKTGVFRFSQGVTYSEYLSWPISSITPILLINRCAPSVLGHHLLLVSLFLLSTFTLKKKNLKRIPVHKPSSITPILNPVPHPQPTTQFTNPVQWHQSSIQFHIHNQQPSSRAKFNDPNLTTT